MVRKRFIALLNKYYITPILLFGIISGFTNADVKLKTVKVIDGVKVKLPVTFIPMSDDDIAIKYPSTKKPLAMYTNPDRLVDFGLNVSKSKFPGNDIKILHQVYKATILDLYQKVEFIQDEIRTINKREFIVFEFTAKFETQRQYSYLLYSLVQDQVYLFNFSCPLHLKDKWKPTAEKVMESVKLRVKTPVVVVPHMKEGVKKYNPRQAAAEKRKAKMAK